MMIVKKQIPLAGPRDRFCGNCRWGDSKLHVCVAKDRVLTEEDLAFYSCSDWEKINAFTTTGNITGMTPVNSVKVPLQPDGSLKMQAKETIGASVVNPDGVAKQKKQEEQPSPGSCCFNCEHRDKMSLKCKLKLSDAVLTDVHSQHEYCDSWEREKDHGVTLRVVNPEEDKKQREAQVQKCLIAKEKGYRRGYMVAELHMMCDAASQLLPDRKPQWERLRNILEDALKAWWARNDQDKQQQEVSHE